MVQKDVMKGPKLLLLDAGQLIVEASGDSFGVPVCSCCFKLSCHSAYRKPNFSVFEWKCICFLLILNFGRLILLWNWTLDLNQNRTLKLVVHIPVFPTVKYRVSSTLLSLPVTLYNNKQNHSLDRAPALSACAEWCVTNSLPGRVQKVVCCSFISCTMYERPYARMQMEEQTGIILSNQTQWWLFILYYISVLTTVLRSQSC